MRNSESGAVLLVAVAAGRRPLPVTTREAHRRGIRAVGGTLVAKAGTRGAPAAHPRRSTGAGVAVRVILAAVHPRGSWRRRVGTRAVVTARGAHWSGSRGTHRLVVHQAVMATIGHACLARGVGRALGSSQGGDEAQQDGNSLNEFGTHLIVFFVFVGAF